MEGLLNGRLMEGLLNAKAEQSIEYAIQQLSIAKNVGDEKEEAEAYNILAWSYYGLRDYQQSIEYAIQQLSIAKNVGDKKKEAEAYNILARSYDGVGDYKQSIEYAIQQLSIAKYVGDKQEEAEAYNILAWSYYGVGDYQQSIEYAIQQLSIAKNVGDEKGKAAAYTKLAWLYYGVGDYQQSIEYAMQHLSINKNVGDKKEEAEAYNILAASYCGVGDYKQSIEYGKKTLSFSKELGREAEEAAYSVLAWSYVLVGDYKQSIEFGKQALSITKELRNRKAEGAAYSVLKMSYNRIGDKKQANEYEKLQLDVQKRALEDKSSSEDFKEAGAVAAGGFSSSSVGADSGDSKEANDKEDSTAGEFSKNISVPSEIKARGPRAKLAYENALKTGKVKVHRARIMLIGQDRAGKTSLKKSFLGLPFDPNEQSTDGIEVDPSKFEVDVDQVKNWQRTDAKLDVSHFVNDLARMVAGELAIEGEETKLDSETEDKPKEIRPQKNPVPNREEKRERTQEARVGYHMVSHSETATREPAIPELKIDPALPPEEFTDLLVQHLKGVNLQSDATTVENHMTLDLWDFAGQHLYYASYPVFLSSRAVYMLVYNLSKGLKSTAQPCVRQGINEILLRNPNNETNLEHLLSWLVSVSTMCSSKSEVDENKATKKDLPYLRPPVFIVGTHADKPHQDIKKIELQIQKEILGKDLQGHVIRPFFAIDNWQGSSGEGVRALQKRMIEVLKQEPYMGEEVPLRWLNFEKVVQALVAEKTYYLTLEQLQTIIQKVCYIENENEAATMLDFYHDLGMIVKHRNTVVLRAQWLIDVFKQLITIRSFSDMEPRHSKLWEEMEATGVLSMELVDHVFSKFCHHGAVKEDILNMMEQFGLIVKFAISTTDVQFFVPCQLKTPPQVEPSPSPSDPCLLYLHFLGGFVPHGIFSQLVSRCTRWCSVSGFKQSPNLFDGASRFFIEKELSHQLILVCKKRFIKVVLMQTQPEHEASFAEIKEVASLVRTFLEETMENLIHELPWLSNLAYDWCVTCPNCPTREEMCSNHGQTSCTDKECLCLLKVLEEGQLSHCPNNFYAKVPTVPGLEKWFLIKAVRPGYHLGTDNVYKMTALPRGITLIINNKLFADHPEHGKQSTRHGSEEDVRRVKELFDALGFQVHAKENLTRLQLLNELDFVACQDHSNYDCFVLWLMSHGKSGEVYCSDGVTLPIRSAEDMLSNCKTLTGKPKLFFIQACRGDDEDEGVAVSADSPTSAQAPSGHVAQPSDEENQSASRISPKHADCLFSFSTVDGYVSYRRSSQGSSYVRALVDVFRERTAHDDLDGILINVNRRVSEMVTIKGYKQMPSFENMLLKKLRF